MTCMIRYNNFHISRPYYFTLSVFRGSPCFKNAFEIIVCIKAHNRDKINDDLDMGTQSISS